MTQKPISAAETPIRVIMITLDAHLSSAAARARTALRRELPGLEFAIHAASDWSDPEALERCRADIARADIIIANMLFLEEHVEAVRDALEARRPHCDALVGCVAAAEIVKLTRLGDFDMQKPATGVAALLKRLRGSKSKSGAQSGRGQMRMLRMLPRILKYIPGKAQDMRSYFLTMQYLLAGSDRNIANMVRSLVGRYAAGPRAGLRGVEAAEPIHYPEVGLYHPQLKGRVTEDLARYPRREGAAGTVGVLTMRSYVLADNTGHYDGVIAALEARGLNVVCAFASGLDSRPAIDAYFMKDGAPAVDALLSLTGFSLVGGPAYNDAGAAEETLAALDVPYLTSCAIEFQSLPQWGGGENGLTPVETTMMVALPEIDGATGPMLYGGRGGAGVCEGCGRRCAFENGDSIDMRVCAERAEMLAGRVARLVALRRRKTAERKVAAIIYDFPPNAGALGSAANLSVFRSLWNTLKALKDQGYTVDLPADVDALRAAILEGNSGRFGAAANVAAFVDAETHFRREPWIGEIEAQWGPSPGKQQSDGSRIFIQGAQFGNVFIGVQPAFGYEGDPMRLLFEKSFAPTHAFSAFYRWIREEFRADVALHFGTHGALEFMPGKQAGLSGSCWPDRLIGDLPNVYLYGANNPSEGAIAKRRSAATLVSYLTPPVAHAGLYKGLLDLKGSVDRWRGLDPQASEERAALAAAIREQAVALDLIADGPWSAEGEDEIPDLTATLRELEQSLIPHGLHVVGEPLSEEERQDYLASVGEALGDDPEKDARLAALEAGLDPRHEIDGLLRALDGRYVRPVAGGDILHAPEIAPTGRNMHGFDPFRLPTPFAVKDGAAQAARLIERYVADHGAPPESVALVLWGADNMKREGAPIAQALALLGAKPRFDGFGRLAGADLIPLETLGRPRIDVVVTLSGIFRDLLPLQTRLLADACLKAAEADEPLEMNAVRRHALAYAQEQGVPLEQAALRVFSNAAGAYGSNVNFLVDSGEWDDEDELAENYTSRKCFAYGVDGRPVKRPELLGAMLRDVQAAYQNIESVEVGITSIDHYFDTLGGVSRAVTRAGGEAAVYVGDQTAGAGKVRALQEQIALETRTRMLNPKWSEAMLAHGHEGVRQIEAHVSNTLGWSATTGQVQPWVYKTLADAFVLDDAMRQRLANLNPKASLKLANRLIEAGERAYWTPDDATWEALRRAGDALEDQAEGLTMEPAA